MTHPRHAVRRFASPSRAALVVALCSSLGLLVACGGKEVSGPTQVVAKVAGEELTELQVNQALERQAGLTPDQLEPVSRKVVAGLVEQEIVLQKARDLKLDRDQRVVQKLETLKREVIARAYLDRIAEGASKPLPKEVQAYFDQNPALFSQRRIYTFQEYSMQADEAQQAALQKQLTVLKSPAELDVYLKTQQIAAQSEKKTGPAENMPLGLLQRLASMKPGQGLIVPTGNRLTVLLLLATQDSPVTEEQARPVIAAYLLNQRRRDAIEKELASLRSASKVEYFGKYADLAASAPQSGTSAQPGGSIPVARTEEQVKADPK